MLTTVSDDISAFIRNDSWTFFHIIGLGQGLKTMAFSAGISCSPQGSRT